jgi:hypothetical protein
MSFADKHFDTVLIPEILEHVPYELAGRIVEEAKRVGKRLVITVPNAEKPNYDKELVENVDHKWFPTKAMVNKLLGNSAQIFESPDRDFIYAIHEA